MESGVLSRDLLVTYGHDLYIWAVLRNTVKVALYHIFVRFTTDLTKGEHLAGSYSYSFWISAPSSTLILRLYDPSKKYPIGKPP